MNSNINTNNNEGLSIDPNLMSSAKRRSVVVVERTSKSTMPSNEGVNAVNNVRGISNGKDLSYTIRGKTLLERSNDLSQLKKGVVAASSPSKRRRSTHKQAKPIWQTVLSCLTKNVLLLAALLYVGQMIWRWTSGIGINSHSPFTILDSDRRIAEVELSLKRTAKLLQAQLDAVDKKIGSEIGTVAREVTKLVEEKGTLLEKELKSLEVRSDDLDNTFSQLKERGLISKTEIDKFWGELKSKREGVIDNDAALDRIRALAKDIVEKEIEKHAADGLGRVDYALASGGATVVKHSEPYVMGKANSWLAVAKVKSSVHSSSHKMLEPSFGEPGQCFALQGSSGFVDIRLRTGIIPDAVTLEHVSKSVAYDRSSAPKDCQVSGWFEGPEDDPTTHSKQASILAEFAFDLDTSNVQTFAVPLTDHHRIINTVRLNFTSNHGSPALTCIYRFRVHGFDPSPLPAVTKLP